MNQNNDNNAPLGPNQILRYGLELMYSERRILMVEGDPWTSKTNMKRFKDHYGASHFLVANLWGDLLTTNHLPAGHDPNARLSIHNLLEALHFLYRYKRESEREATFDKTPKTLRKWCWYYLKRIQALKAKKIVFPDNFGEDIWIMTVDGVHCATYEPNHPVFSMDPKYYSHKKKRAGLCYELGIHLYESKLIWMNGPFPSGRNDNGNFVEGGLKQKLASIRKKALGDKIYNGHPNECSTFNASDDPAVKKFKSRAQMRHEKFNGMMKEFSCIHECFRHGGEESFGICFEAIAVICQYRMEHGEQLFDLLAGVSLDENAGTNSGSETESSDDETDEDDTDEDDTESEDDSD